MSISINNNTTSLVAQNNIQKASIDAERAIARLSSGKANAFPGDRVSEIAIATTLSSNATLQKVALDTTMQASQLIDITYTAMDEMLTILGRQEAIAAQAGSDTMTDIERKSLQREFGTLTQQFDLIAEQANYNGVTLLTGKFSGASYIKTQQNVSRIVYDITRPDQYVSHGVIAENPVLETKSSVTIVDKIGKDRAHGFISFSENLQVGDKIILNGKAFSAVAHDTVTTAADQFKLGCNLCDTLENLVKVLNISEFQEVAPASYRVERTDLIDKCDDENVSCAESKGLRLAVDYNVVGTVGNDFVIGTELASPADPGRQAARGSLSFDTNLRVGDEVHVNGVVFIATNNPEAARNDKNFLLGKTITETITAIVDKLDSSRIATVSLAKYAQGKNAAGELQDKIIVEYKDAGYLGNKFIIGASSQSGSGADLGGKPATSGAIDLTAVFADGDTITIGGVKFTAASTADADTKTFKSGDINANLASLNDAIKAAVTTGDLKTSIVASSSAANKLTLSAAENGAGANSIAYSIKITSVSSSPPSFSGNLTGGIDDSTPPAKVKVNDTYFQSSNGTPVVGNLVGGESLSTGSQATLVVSYDQTTNYAKADKISFAETEYTFTDADPASNVEVMLGDSLAQTMGNLVKAVNSNNEGFSLEYDYITGNLTIRAKSSGTESILGNGVDDEGNLIDKYSFDLSGTAKLKLTKEGAADAFDKALTALGGDKPAVGSIGSIVEHAIAKSEKVYDRTQFGVNRQIIESTNKVNINNTGEAVPKNGAISGALLGGIDQTTGSFASTTIDFSFNVQANLNFSDGDRITLNNQLFTFTNSTVTDEHNNSSTMPLTQNSVHVGSNIDDALNNLAQIVNATTNGASDALLQYDKTTHKLYITAKNTGFAGNDYNFNFGGAATKYDIGIGPTSDDKTWTIKDVVQNNPKSATLGTENKPVMFSQNMKGEFSELKALFKAGSSEDEEHQFTSNSVKFMIRLNGETYETEYVNLAGGNKTSTTTDGKGYQHLGDFLDGGTKLVFQRIGGDPTEAGFSLNVRPEGLKIQSDSSVEEVQKELNNLMSTANHAVETSQLNIGLAAEGHEVISYGLNSIDQFIGSGAASAGSHLSGNVEVLASTGLTKAQGVIEFKNNNFQNGDFLTINGTKVAADQDFTVGGTLTDTMANIVAYLNNSQDTNIAQAFYSLSDDNRVVITYKQAGSIGNNFTLSAEFIDRCGVGGLAGGTCDEPDKGAQDKLNGVRINGNTHFLSITPEISLGQKEANVSDAHVVLGENNKNVDDIIPAHLMGGIENLTANYIDGYSSGSNPNAFIPNAIIFSATVNNNVYTGQVDLSGGNRFEGVTNGNGYNGYGNLIAGGSKITLNSGDGTHAIVLTVDKDGVILPGMPDGQTSRNDVLRALGKVTSSMNTGLSNVAINQKRQVASFDVNKTSSTLLRGIKAENVFYQGPNFDDGGQAGLIGNFSVDNTKSIISVKIGDLIYSQQLDRDREEGGLGSNYDAFAKIIKGGPDSSLVLTTKDSDARALIINLQGVADIDISTESGAQALADALGLAFGSSDGSGLHYQIGIKPTDSITLTFPDVTSQAMYRDDNNQYVKIDVLTRESSIEAAHIVHNAIDRLRQERATIGATQGQFEAVASNLRVSIRALKSSVAVLADADIAEVSADYALSALRVNAASAAFVHALTALRDMVGRILQM